MAWSYTRTLTVTGSSVLLPSTQTNFPVLVKISHATLKTVANGGHINNTVTAASGPAVTMPADLIFTSDSAGTTKIPWEVDAYDGTNGVLWAHVLIASCALSSVFYCLYGDAAIVAAQNTGSFTPANVWDSSYKGVWHLGDLTTLLGTDSTSNANNLSATNAPTSATGQIGGAGKFNGTSNYLGASTKAWADTVFTLEGWMKVDWNTAKYRPMLIWNYGGSAGLALFTAGGTAQDWNSKDIFAVGNGFQTGQNPRARISYVAAGSPANASWHYVAATLSNTQKLLYFDGVSITLASGATSSVPSTTGNLQIGGSSATSDFNDGTVDEVRISNTARSADWITATYNAQNDPTTFVSIGSESAVGGSGGPFPFFTRSNLCGGMIPMNGGTC